MTTPLRLMVYDATWQGTKPDQWLLTSSWIAGGLLYRALGRIDAVHGATSWADALVWLQSIAPGRPIAEVQYWGHGKWGRVLIGGDRLDRAVLEDQTDPLTDTIADVRARMTPSSLVWFRTCMTFGTDVGHAFARACAHAFGCRVAGHTYVVGPLQSGLHSLAPGQEPAWPVDEGVARGDEQSTRWTRAYTWYLNTRDRLLGRAPKKKSSEPAGLMSSRTAPRTITCLHGAVPDGW